MGDRVGIVGGGAAGLAAAVTAARLGAQVTVLEGNDRPGRKLLATGNGRCNLGNENLALENYYTKRPEMLGHFLGHFGSKETRAFFQSMGLMVKSRRGGLYPVCDQAAAVLDVLRCEAAAQGVETVAGCRVEQVEKARRTGGIRVLGAGQEFRFDRVILACGGRAAPKTGSDGSGYVLAERLGHSLVDTVPALVQLQCGEDYFKAVSGVRADAELRVLHRGRTAARERGELQLTDRGISGIPVFQFSRVVNYILKDLEEKGVPAGKRQVEVAVNFLPDYTEEEFVRLAAGRKILGVGRTVEEFFTGVLHKKLMLLFIRLAGLKPSQDAGSADREKLGRVWELCRNWVVHVTGSGSYDSAQACAGGVPLDEVTLELESKKQPGIYFAGEILDVDGKCGGYNLHWAWCSGSIAGRAAAGGRAGKPFAEGGNGRKRPGR